MYKDFFKRVLDITIAVLILIFSFPILISAVLLLFIANSGKPFFTQQRPGKRGKIFTIIKLKTMNDRKGNNGQLLEDVDRLTNIGKFIRKTSVDEIPQLLNVIKGDMSLVGPRPLLVEYLPFYNSIQQQRHEVRPGITGWAQVNGRNAINWDEKLEYDIWYVNNYDFKLDIKILLMTVKKVFRPEGITAEGHATMPTFIDYVRSKKIAENK